MIFSDRALAQADDSLGHAFRVAIKIPMIASFTDLVCGVREAPLTLILAALVGVPKSVLYVPWSS